MQSSPTAPKVTIFQSLGIDDFRWLLFGGSAFFMAMNMQMITRGWLILKLTNDSPLALSVVMMAFGLPMALFSPMGGALTDRFSKKKMIIACQMGNVVFTVLLAVLDMTGAVRYWHMIATGVINGTLMAVNMPSRQVFVSDVVPPRLLMNAISLGNSTMNLTRILGPALAGILIIYLNTWGVLYLIAGFYLVSAISVLFIKNESRRTQKKIPPILADIAEGFVHAVHMPTMRALLLLMLVPAFFGFALVALLPVWAKSVLEVQSDGLGWLMTTNGIGALTGSLILAAISGIGKRGRLLLVVGMAWGVCLILFSKSTAYPVALPLLFMIGLMNSGSLALNMTLVQTYAEDRMRGRMVSISTMIFGGAPLGIVPLGLLAEKIGTADTLAICGLVLIVYLAVFGVANRSYRSIQ